ncbi:MAG: hypothetical protein ACOX52_11800 [Verrucomicrobiota bacterium]|jgi:hypothetical protein
MRHHVNFGLLFCFVTLALSGAMAFLRPFSIVTTRIHIVFGVVTIGLVGLHLLGRARYFRNQLAWRNPKRSSLPPLHLLGMILAWGLLLATAWLEWAPVPTLIRQGYEAKHRAEIVRTSPLAGFLDPELHIRTVARQPGPDADVALSLTIVFQDPELPAPSIAVWTESTTGSMIETLYIDSTLAFSEEPVWGGRPTPRNHILPLWRNRYTLISGVDPKGEIDAFTGTTPSHSFTLDDYLNLGENEAFVLCVEVNAPHDPNPAFPDPHIGQPSILYTAYIEPDADQKYAILERTGHGGGAEENGAIQYNLDDLTTAGHLVDLLLAKTAPQ